jgi:hypothetical protein
MLGLWPWVGVYYLVIKEIKSGTASNWNHFNVIAILHLLLGPKTRRQQKIWVSLSSFDDE